jgi:hypothetical protein
LLADLPIDGDSEQLLHDKYFNGVIVRSLETVRIAQVRKSEHKVVFEQHSQISHTGTFAAIPTRWDMISDVSQNISLNDSGAITSNDQTSTSWIKTITGAIKTTTDAL